MFTSNTPIQGRRQSFKTFAKGLTGDNSHEDEQDPLAINGNANGNGSSQHHKPTSSTSQSGGGAASGLQSGSPPRPVSDILGSHHHRERRVNTHSIPLSYAYGAPTTGSGHKPRSSGGGSSTGGGHHRHSSSRGGGLATDAEGESLRSGSAGKNREGDGLSTSGVGEGVELSGPEKAAVRYARLRERKAATGTAAAPGSQGAHPVPAAHGNSTLDSNITNVNASGVFPSTGGPRVSTTNRPPKTTSGNSKDTSVNIATAFKQAQETFGGSVRPSDIRGAGEDDEDSMSVEKDTQHGDGQEGANGDAGAGGNGAEPVTGKRKRKKRKSGVDSTYKHKRGETDSEDSELGEGIAGGRAKRARKAPETPPVSAPTSATGRKKSSGKRRRTKKGGTGTGGEEDDSSDEEGGEGIALTRGRRNLGRKSLVDGEDEEEEEEEDQDEEEEMEEEEEEPQPETMELEGESPATTGPAKRKRTSRKRKSTANRDGVYQQGSEGEDSDEYTRSGARRRRKRTTKGKGAAGGAPDTPDVSMNQIPPVDSQEQSLEVSVSQEEPPQRTAGHAATYYLRQATPSASLSSPDPSVSNGRSMAGDAARARLQFNNQQLASPGPDRSTTFGSDSVSGVHGSSYDYSEEERIVKEVEKRNKSVAAAGLRKRKVPGPADLGMTTVMGKEEADGNGDVNFEPDTPSFSEKLGNALSPLYAVLLWLWEVIIAVGTAIGRGLGVCHQWMAANDNRLKSNARRHPFWTGAILLFAVLVIISALFPGEDTEESKSSASWSWVPSFSRKGTYTPPNLPPESIERLTLLEKAVSDLSQLTEAERSRTASRFGTLERDLASERKRASHEESELVKSLRDHGSSMAATQTDVNKLSSTIKTLQEARAADALEIRNLASAIDSLGNDLTKYDAKLRKDIAAFETKVAALGKDMAAADPDRIAQIAVNSVEKILPERLAVKVDPKSGKLDISPAFWAQLREKFMDKKGVQDTVKAEVGSEMAKRPVPAAPSETGSTVTVRPPTWQEFLTANEASLKSWVDSDLQQKSNAGVVVSKQQFLDVLRREMKSLKSEFEKTANENVQRIGEEMLAKVAKQEQVKKDTSSSFRTPFGSKEKSVTLKTSDGQNVTELVGALVDAALLRHSKDVIAQPDYALYTAGGRVIPRITSPLYEVRPEGFIGRIMASTFGTGIIYGRPPVTALHHDCSVGNCWPFSGSSGNLGIHLTRRIIVTGVTIEHASKEIAYDVSGAPRDFELWGVVETNADVQRLKEDRDEQAQKHAAARPAHEGEAIDLDQEPMASVPPSPNHILLASGAYDPDTYHHIQSFQTTAQAQRLEIPVGVVILKILSNQGNEYFTCLYRVRVHGHEPSHTDDLVDTM